MLRTIVPAALLLVFVSATSAPSAAQASQNPTLEFANGLLSAQSLPNVVVAVGVRGKMEKSAAVGWADIERKTTVTSNTLFRIGSISKLLTATTALRLTQAGGFDLDAPLSRYLDQLPEDKRPITPRQILGHLSGFKHYGRDDYVNTVTYANVQDALPRLLAMPLLAAPGAKYAYSSYGFNVLGGALQAAAHKEYRQLVAERVTKPLGLTHTMAEAPPLPSGRATLYSKTNDALSPSAPSDVTDRWPSGGFLSTAEDLVRFGMGFLTPAFLKADLREIAFTSQRGEDGKDTGVGLAWRIGRDEKGRRYVHHGGDSIGGRAFILIYPDEGVVIAITTSVGQAAFGEKEALAAAQPFLR